MRPQYRNESDVEIFIPVTYKKIGLRLSLSYTNWLTIELLLGQKYYDKSEPSVRHVVIIFLLFVNCFSIAVSFCSRRVFAARPLVLGKTTDGCNEWERKTDYVHTKLVYCEFISTYCHFRIPATVPDLLQKTRAHVRKLKHKQHALSLGTAAVFL